MRPHYHHGDLRRQLVTEARLALVRNPDPSALSIRELARRIGVSQNAPYRHFPDRDHLLGAVAAVGFEEAATQLANRHPGGAAAVADVWESMATREPGLVALMQRAMPGGEVEVASRTWLAEVVRAIEPEVGGEDPERLVRRAIGCWATILGMTALEHGGLLAGLDEWMVPGSAGLAKRVVARR